MPFDALVSVSGRGHGLEEHGASRRCNCVRQRSASLPRSELRRLRLRDPVDLHRPCPTAAMEMLAAKYFMNNMQYNQFNETYMDIFS